MNKKYKIKYLPVFYEDLDLITDYIMYKLNNLIVVNKFIDTIEEKILERSYNPKGYEQYIVNEKETYYRLYIKNYTIFYTVKEQTMEIRRIIYSKRNLDKLIWIYIYKVKFMWYIIYENIKVEIYFNIKNKF